MVLDSRFTAALHVETLRRDRIWEHLEPHVLFQASTIGALLEGRYDGDVTFAELAEHGDLGLGTLNGLDGEMIALDGSFFRADVDGRISEIDPSARTPFAVVVAFRPSQELSFGEPADKDALLSDLEERIPAGSGACAIRIDGRFEAVRARSVPRQEPPYRPLAEVVEDQHVFDLGPGDGSIVGFRFPDHGEGVEVAGFHLHYISGDRERGGHVLDFRAAEVTARLDPSSDLHVELPPGVDLSESHLDGDVAGAVRRVESEG
jgi:acetolactate decarboxylase